MTEVGQPISDRQRRSEAPWRPPSLGAQYLKTTEQMLIALPADYHALSAVLAIAGQRPDVGTITAGKPASKPPINLAVDALRTELVFTAAIWEEVIRDHCNLSPRRDGAMREEHSLVQSVSILAPRADVLCALPPVDAYFDGVESGLVRRDGLAGARHLHRIHDAVHRTIGRAAVVIRLPGTCPGCDALTALRRETGTDTVYCACCDGRWTHDDYRKYVGLVIGGAL